MDLIKQLLDNNNELLSAICGSIIGGLFSVIIMVITLRSNRKNAIISEIYLEKYKAFNSIILKVNDFQTFFIKALSYSDIFVVILNDNKIDLKQENTSFLNDYISNIDNIILEIEQAENICNTYDFKYYKILKEESGEKIILPDILLDIENNTRDAKGVLISIINDIKNHKEKPENNQKIIESINHYSRLIENNLSNCKSIFNASFNMKKKLSKGNEFKSI